MMKDNSYYDFRFAGISRLYGVEKALKLRRSHVLVIGLGGVGSWAVEALARTGIEKITLVDFDDICVSNTNRQLHTLESTIGKMKSQALKERLLLINKNIDVHLINIPFSRDNEGEIFVINYDVVIDCIDNAEIKTHLILACKERGQPIVTVGSAGGRIDPTQIKIDDLSKTEVDPMLHIMRKELRRKFGFPRLPKKMGITTVYSTESPAYPTADGCTVSEKPEEFLKPLDCHTGFGTATHITGTFGFWAAHAGIQKIISD